MKRKINHTKSVAGPTRQQGWVAILMIVGITLLPAQGPSQQEMEKQVRVLRAAAEGQGVARLVARYAGHLNAAEQSQVTQAIIAYAAQYRLDPLLIMALIRVESGFRPRAVSSEEAMGLMQLRPFVAHALARDLNVELKHQAQIYDIEANVHLGSAYLAHLMRTFDYDILTALTAYNYGPTRIQGYLREGRALPTGYARKVLAKYASMTGLTPYQVQI